MTQLQNENGKKILDSQRNVCNIFFYFFKSVIKDDYDTSTTVFPIRLL